MAAVLGGDPDAVLGHLDAYGLTPANRNGAGQIVAAGPTDGLARLAAQRPPGTKVVALSVAGAFHTAAMESAQDALSAVAHGITGADPAPLVRSNARRTAVTPAR